MDSKNRYDENFKLLNGLNNDVDDLFITSKFPPSTDVSGIVLSKRIIKLNKKVDVLYSNFAGEKDEKFNSLLDNYINERIIVDGNYSASTVNGVNYFRKKGMDKLNELNKQYKTIVSRSWTLESHFLALDYKLEHPEVKWIAEFSDPMRFDVNNNLREGAPFITDENYFNNINNKINDINIKEFGEDVDKYFPKIDSGDELYFLVEYLPFLFADVIRFTNFNQRQVMLDSFPYDIKNYVLLKSEVSRHPTLEKEYYYLMPSSYEINEDYLNFAYFGTYLGKRHLEYLFKSFEELNEEIRDKIRIHLFVPNPDLIKINLKDLDVFNNIIIGDKVPFLEFLNLTTQMDVLIVNDLLTEGIFDINPYLPSKSADYEGSGADIWYICEKGSSMDKFDVKYKSYINKYDSSKQVLGEILSDKLQIKLDIFKKNVDSEEYYHDRLTNLNNILEDVYKQRIYWVNQTNLSKNKINQLSSDIKSKNDKLDSFSRTIADKNNEIKILSEDVKSKNDKLDNLSKDIVNKDDEINILSIDVKSKNDKLDSLSRTIADKNNEIDDLLKEIESLKDQVFSANAERKNLCDDYFELHEITQNSFDLLKTKDETINDLNKELKYYKNHGNLFRRFILTPLEYFYLVFSSDNGEIKINYELLKKIRNGNWFNRGYYIEQNKDLSKFRWVKIFSPELHYICHGFEENRLPNRETKENNSKKDLLKKLTYIVDSDN